MTTTTQRNYQDLLNRSSVEAIDQLAELCAHPDESRHDLATRIVEAIVEAATARTFLRLETEGAKRRRRDAVDVLQPNLCGACVELLDPEPEVPAWTPIGQGDDVPGSTELAERSLFLGWSGRVAELPPGGPGGGDGPRFELISELHASVSARHPLGIAETLYQVIGALHAGADNEAEISLEDLAHAELSAAKNEKAEGVLGALRVLVDPELDEVRTRGELELWTLEELVLVEAWADQAYKAATAEATIPTYPAVVAALERELDA